MSFPSSNVKYLNVYFRMNLSEVHTSLLLICLLEAGLPDALVEVIVSSDSFLSLQASILLGKKDTLLIWHSTFPYISNVNKTFLYIYIFLQVNLSI